MEVEFKGDIKDVVSCFKYLGSCFSGSAGQQEGVRMRLGEEVKISGARKLCLMSGV